jgi:hypothetical protein
MKKLLNPFRKIGKKSIYKECLYHNNEGRSYLSIVFLNFIRRLKFPLKEFCKDLHTAFYGEKWYKFNDNGKLDEEDVLVL